MEGAAMVECACFACEEEAGRAINGSGWLCMCILRLMTCCCCSREYTAGHTCIDAERFYFKRRVAKFGQSVNGGSREEE